MADFAPYRPHDHGRADAQVVIRAASDDDAATLADLESTVRHTTSSPDAMAAAIADPQRLVVVAVAGDEVVGWAKTHWWDWSFGPAEAGQYLGGLTVDPRWRRRGIASTLTGVRMSWIFRRAPCAWYVVNAQNLASIDLHRAWGFVEVVRAEKFHTVRFRGGVGLLLRADAPVEYGDPWRPSVDGDPF
ncbi:GNAT family N-acetyltransferase [Cellulomonas humilata]|uniref:Ribosomal protein S18 acetylase RimI-like enzyme n=1 Tax=Cellulomonas humilata TaxID=144055 RepID=A0ABU0EGZ9_9CELL|nr:GNAT family N-acetyltransferase [Cellulomonas humilata]MDQ0374536.1 ribosomal protein S18 acetylase RimI-like enzyme [Cellulomonas humilata]